MPISPYLTVLMKRSEGRVRKLAKIFITKLQVIGLSKYFSVLRH